MDKLDERVGRLIEELRTRRGWNQGQLAEAARQAGLEWSQRIVSRVETGDRPMRFVESFQLASALGVSPSELYPYQSRIAVERGNALLHLSEARGHLDNARDLMSAATNRALAWQLVFELADGLESPVVVHGPIELFFSYLSSHQGDWGADSQQLRDLDIDREVVDELLDNYELEREPDDAVPGTYTISIDPVDAAAAFTTRYPNVVFETADDPAMFSITGLQRFEDLDEDDDE